MNGTLTGSTHAWGSRARSAFPAGSNGEFNLPPELTTVIESGHGCRLRSADGREFIDFSMGWGSALPGHAHPTIVEAVQRAVVDGANFAGLNRRALELAERLITLSPACERVRFCASGTEATMYCLRLARAATGREKVLRFEGAYHGASDIGTISLFPRFKRPYPEPEPTSAGIEAAVVGNTLIAPYNDLDVTRALIDRHHGELAAVIVEPFHRCLSPVPGFLEGVRDACSRSGVLLIFDEVVTGFRLALAGAQERYGVIPDLVAYGKALGGGMPIGAFGGRSGVMDLTCEDRMGRETYVWTASTLGGNPVSCAAALAALDLYAQPETYPRLYGLGERLRQLMRIELDRAGVGGQVIGDGPLAQVVFSDEPFLDYRQLPVSAREKARSVMLDLFRSGVYLNPMGTKLYLSLAHTEQDLEAFAERFGGSLEA